MTAELQKANGFAALSPEQQQDHRAKIGVRARAILGQFWRDDSTPDAVQLLELEGWMDVLQTCSHSEIRWAWAIYQQGGPRTGGGRLYKPDPGYLHRLVMARRRADVLPDDPVALCGAVFRQYGADEWWAREYRRLAIEAEHARRQERGAHSDPLEGLPGWMTDGKGRAP